MPQNDSLSSLIENEEKEQEEIYPNTDLIMQVVPNADVTNVKKYMPLVFKEMAKAGMTSPQEIISILATIYAETGNFAPREEIGGKGKYNDKGLLPNGRSPHGRGFIQCTWYDNYKAFTDDTGIDILNNPDKLVDDPVVAAKNLIWFFQGGQGKPYWTSLGPAAKSGDYANVRSIVNRGLPNKLHATTQSGTKKFMDVVERGKKLIQQSLKPGDLDDLEMPSNYGMGDIDPGGGGQRDIVRPNIGNQGSALMHALGINARDRMHSHEARFTISVANFPEILKLEAQQSFHIKDIDGAVDGIYVLQEIEFIYDKTLIAKVYATRPDGNAPEPTTFLHDSKAGLTGNGEDSIPPPKSGDLNERIAQAARNAEGKPTHMGPDGGRNACAWAVNKFVIVPVLGKALGKNSNYVPSVVKDIESGKGSPIEPRSEANPGDIAIMGNDAHIGIVLSPGGDVTLSNGSSAASFSWKTSFAGYDDWYSHPSRVYRLKSNN